MSDDLERFHFPEGVTADHRGIEQLELSALRTFVFERDGFRCVWPGCTIPLDDLQLAHLTHRGMGGNPKANVPANCATLCRYHHDILDGRTVKGRRFEVSELLRAYLGRRN